MAPLNDIGDPKIIGIEDFLHPPFGDGPVVREDDVFIFWGCGISMTEQLMNSQWVCTVFDLNRFYNLLVF